MEAARTSSREWRGLASLAPWPGAAAALVALITACSSPGTNPDGGGDRAAADIASSSPDSYGAGDDRGPDARDAAAQACYPRCIEELRAACPVPVVGEGTCVLDTHDADGGLSICYSSGVRSIQTLDDAGVSRHATITKADGKTPCYYQDRMSTSELRYSAITGTMVAVVIFHDDGSATVTCAESGSVFQISAATLSAPACRPLSVSSCPIGDCP